MAANIKKWRNLPFNIHSRDHAGTTPPWWPIMLPGLMSLPILRSPLGYDIVHIFPALWRAMFLVILPPLMAFFWVGFGGTLPANLGHRYLVAYAFAYVVVNTALYVRRWFGQRAHEELHSCEAGYSWLVWYTPLPVALCELVIVPVAVVLAGKMLLSTISFELGWWLILSGISLFLMALWEQRRNWSQRRATVNDIVHAKAFETRVDRAAAPTGASPGNTTPDFADLA